MSTTKLTIDPTIAKRLRDFLCSDFFFVKSSIAKSEYWKHYAAQLQTTIDEGRGGWACISGVSGFYVPASASFLQRIKKRTVNAIKSPKKIISWAQQQIEKFFVLRLMSYERAFDSVMCGDEVTEPVLSKFLINHRRLAKVSGVLPSSAAILEHYQKWSGYQASANIINHYYYRNLLCNFVKLGELKTIMEIGSGNGNFASILYADWAPNRVILVDLPETLATAIPFLSNLFPKARLILPHELSQKGLDSEFDFAFLTVDQVDAIQNNSVDLAINCHSFQEMTHRQIEAYFRLVQKVCKPSALFFVANRLEKIPCGPDAFTVDQPSPPNRFEDYPWDKQNIDLIHEISKLHQLTQTRHVGIRLQRIVKY